MKTLPDMSGEVFGENVDFPVSETVLLDEELASIDDNDLELSIVAIKRHIDVQHINLMRTGSPSSVHRRMDETGASAHLECCVLAPSCGQDPATHA